MHIPMASGLSSLLLLLLLFLSISSLTKIQAGRGGARGGAVIPKGVRA